ncbi:MAG: hypothetical protein ACKO9Z_10225 [Planctomycetota bacterium]|nr:hypothetical protein [Planctomycetota bacterium]
MKNSVILGLLAVLVTGCQSGSMARNNGERHGLFSACRNSKRHDTPVALAAPVPICTPVVVSSSPCPTVCAPSPCPPSTCP